MNSYSRKHKKYLSFKTFKEMIINCEGDFGAFRSNLQNKYLKIESGRFNLHLSSYHNFLDIDTHYVMSFESYLNDGGVDDDKYIVFTIFVST